jgi:hypothetical protein
MLKSGIGDDWSMNARYCMRLGGLLAAATREYLVPSDGPVLRLSWESGGYEGASFLGMLQVLCFAQGRT